MSGTKPSVFDCLPLLEAFASSGSVADLTALRNSAIGMKVKGLPEFLIAVAGMIRQGQVVGDVKAALVEAVKALPAAQIVLQQNNENRNEVKRVGDTYENKGQAGAMGPNANVHGNVFTQNVAADVAGTPVSPLDLKALDELIDQLPSRVHGALTKSAAIQAAGELMKVKEAYEGDDHEAKVKAVTSWREWLMGRGDEILKAIGTVGVVVKIAAPLAKLLGLPV